MESSPRRLAATLSMWSASGLLIGNIIGSGIFATPGSALARTHSSGLSLVSWIVAGFVAMLGTASYADLATSIPKSGGEYTYLFRCYGQLYAFLFSWTSNLIIKPSGVAILALICGEYAIKPFYLHGSSPNWLATVVALAVILIATILNILSIRLTALTQRWLTYAKLAAIAVVVVLGIIYFARRSSAVRANYDRPFAGSDYSPGQFGVAVIACLFAYDGWNNLNFIVEEIKDPVRNIPRSLFTAIPLVILCYVAANASYMAVLPLDQIADFSSGQTVSGFVTAFGDATMGLGGQIFFSISIALSCFGSTCGGIFVASRIVHESATRGDFPHIFTKLYGVAAPTPIASVIFEAVVAAVLLLSGGFSTLLNLFSVAEWVFYTAAAFTVIVLRWTEPDLVRPFRVWIIVPALFCLCSAGLIVALFIEVFFLKERYRWFEDGACLRRSPEDAEHTPLIN